MHTASTPSGLSAPALLARLGMAAKSARIRRHLTQQALADELGVSRPTIAAIEAGRGVSSYTLFALLEALGLSLSIQPAAPAPVAHRRPTIRELIGAERQRRQRLLQAESGPRDAA